MEVIDFIFSDDETESVLSSSSVVGEPMELSLDSPAEVLVDLSPDNELS